jgi:hypothetical protein
VLSFINSFQDLPSGLVGLAAAAVLLPISAITSLLICATVVALSAGRERGERARLILVDLLDVLRALFRCDRGGR